MATTTTNLGLTKPVGTEQALISVINGNMDIIDTKVGAVPANKNVQGEIDSLSDQIGTYYMKAVKISKTVTGGVTADTAYDLGTLSDLADVSGTVRGLCIGNVTSSNGYDNNPRLFLYTNGHIGYRAGWTQSVNVNINAVAIYE